MPDWRDNPGSLPVEAKGKRVVVELFSGTICGKEPVSSSCPAGWAADGKQGCNWAINDPPEHTDIRRYYVI